MTTTSPSETTRPPVTNLQALLTLYLLQDWLRVRAAGTESSPSFFLRHGVVPALTSENRKVSLRLAREAACLYCEEPIGGDSTGDHIVAVAAGGPGGVENYLPLCKRCNSSKGVLDLLDWWHKKGRRADELPCDVLCAYVRLTYQQRQRLRTINAPAPETLMTAISDLARLLPTADHKSTLWKRVQWVTGLGA